MNETNIDNKLKELFKQKLPEHPKNQWFTLKVMNRLPAKRNSRGSYIESIGFFIGAIVLCFLWILHITETKHAQVLTIGDILTYATLIGITFCLLIGFLISLLRKI